jgi:TRAP-type C4-dicarboxylate transport system permease small subunit
MWKVYADDIVGTVINPLPAQYKNIVGGGTGGGLILFMSNILRLVFVVAGIFAFINFIIAGFQYMNAAGDTKSLATAWNRILYSLVGLIVIVGSFAIAALMGQVFFGNPNAILSPMIYGPN